MIKPCYYKGERGNKPYELELMLRLYLIQNLYNLADEATVAEVTDSRAFSDFCGVESSNQIPDGDTLGRFRNLLVKTSCRKALCTGSRTAYSKRADPEKGTIVDSTIIAAPTSTKTRNANVTLTHIRHAKGTRGISAIKRISELIRTVGLRIPLKPLLRIFTM